MKDAVKKAARGAMLPIGRALRAVGLTANGVTLLGVLFSLPAAWGFAEGRNSVAFGFLLASGLCDMLDGAVARAGGGGGTKFGAAFDSTLDRYGEGVVFGGIVFGLVSRGAADWLVWVALLAGVASFLTSYVRARAEGLGIACEVGVLERPERVVLLLVLALWGDGGAIWILSALALLAHITFIQRLAHVWKATQGKPLVEAPGSGEAGRRARG
ncbi:MAG: CDP-alcohol phosphatidyltransferase family protein [Candidatus Eisenbacteria bacterium]